MREKIRQALTRTIYVKTEARRKPKLVKVEVPPSQRLILCTYLSITALTGLIALEIAHMAILGSFNKEIFSVITALLGTITGIIMAKRM